MTRAEIEYILSTFGGAYDVIPPTRHCDRAKVVDMAVKAMQQLTLKSLSALSQINVKENSNEDISSAQ